MIIRVRYLQKRCCSTRDGLSRRSRTISAWPSRRCTSRCGDTPRGWTRRRVTLMSWRVRYRTPCGGRCRRGGVHCICRRWCGRETRRNGATRRSVSRGQRRLPWHEPGTSHSVQTEKSSLAPYFSLGPLRPLPRPWAPLWRRASPTEWSRPRHPGTPSRRRFRCRASARGGEGETDHIGGEGHLSSLCRRARAARRDRMRKASQLPIASTGAHRLTLTQNPDGRGVMMPCARRTPPCF